MGKTYIYVVDRDFGFAPNPFHGCCTLATCKPRIRRVANIGDWIIGMGGSRLAATGKCVFAMRVTQTLTFNEYWSAQEYRDKRPVRNGSSKMMVGDNIYHRDGATRRWSQSDSHHSNADGSANAYNLHKDTSADRVLISKHFFYFGRSAKIVPPHLLRSLGYKNPRDYRVFDARASAPLIAWFESAFRDELNQVADDPFDFDQSGKRYSAGTNKIS